MVYMYHSFLIHSSADGHLGCFHVLAIIKSAAMNIGVHVSLSDLVSLVCMPKKILFIYLWLCWVSVAMCRLSLVVASRGCSLLEAQGLLIAVASFVVENWALGVQVSVVVTQRLSYPKACSILPDHWWNWCPLHWQVDSLPLDHQGSPETCAVI